MSMRDSQYYRHECEVDFLFMFIIYFYVVIISVVEYIVGCINCVLGLICFVLMSNQSITIYISERVFSALH